MLHQRLADAEQKLQMAAPIPVYRVRTCSHPECGARAPRNPPTDCLVIRLGCKYEPPFKPRDDDSLLPGE